MIKPFEEKKKKNSRKEIQQKKKKKRTIEKRDRGAQTVTPTKTIIL